MNPTLLQQLDLTLTILSIAALTVLPWYIFMLCRQFNDLRKAKNELEQLAERNRKRRVSGMIDFLK